MTMSPPGSGKTREGRIPSRSSPSPKITDETISGLADVFKMLADESRLRILLALSQDGELHVSALCQLVKQSQPAVSHHLTLLRMQGLVGFRREGKHNFYRVASGLVRDLLEKVFSDSGSGLRQLHFEDFSLVYKRK
jgi:DNA-binding transcriptional ArsR family regulator